MPDNVSKSLYYDLEEGWHIETTYKIAVELDLLSGQNPTE